MKLGYLQRDMIRFMKNADKARGRAGRYHIARDRDTRRVATSLEKRGMIVVDRAYECWIVRMA